MNGNAKPKTSEEAKKLRCVNTQSNCDGDACKAWSHVVTLEVETGEPATAEAIEAGADVINFGTCGMLK